MECMLQTQWLCCRLKVTALGHLLSLQPREVTALARKCPNLLVCNSDSLADKFASLKSLMAVGGIGSKQVRIWPAAWRMLYLRTQQFMVALTSFTPTSLAGTRCTF
jgi:hypothetical protein